MISLQKLKLDPDRRTEPEPRNHGRTDGWMDRQTDGRTDGRTDRRTDGPTDQTTDGKNEKFKISNKTIRFEIEREESEREKTYITTKQRPG